MAEVMRKAVIFCSAMFTLIGMGLSIAAILTPSWQVVNLQEYNSIHEHGLWLDCTRHVRDGGGVLLRRYATVTEPLHCVYKFDYDKYSGTFDLEDDNSPIGEVNRHKFYGWHTATLIMLALALITSFCSICLGACGCCYASLSLVFTATTLLTTFLSSVAEGVFFFFSHRADNRFIKGIVGTYEQRVGLAFFLQMAACFFHFIAFLVAMVATYFAFTRKGVALDRERYSLQTSSKTNVTNMGRASGIVAVANDANDDPHHANAANRPLLLHQHPMPQPPPSFHSRPASTFDSHSLVLAAQQQQQLGGGAMPGGNGAGGTTTPMHSQLSLHSATMPIQLQNARLTPNFVFPPPSNNGNGIGTGGTTTPLRHELSREVANFRGELVASRSSSSLFQMHQETHVY